MTTDQSIDHRIAERVRSLRTERGLSLDDLAARSGISRSSLSRIENAEVSATAAALGKLGAAFGLTMSRLIGMVEEDFSPLIVAADQPVWEDAASGIWRRQISPPSSRLDGEVIEVRLAPGAEVRYDGSPRPGLEHHLLLIEGALTLVVDGRTFRLAPHDCLRYRLDGSNTFRADPDTGSHYLLFIV